MTKLTRLTAKIFGETATATGDDPEIGQFGSALAGTYVGTTDVATIQSLPAWSNGFIDSVTPSTQFPPLPEMTGFGKVLSYQTAYTLQQGVPEWDSATVYYQNSFCAYNGEIYKSLTDSNLNNNPSVDSNNWVLYVNTINKADTDLANVINAGKSLACTWSFPSGTYETLTPVSSGQYTAPAYGWFQLAMRQTQTYNKSGVIEIFNQTKAYGTYIAAPEGSTYRVFLPVSKNDVVEISFVGHAPSVGLTFHYAQGTEFEYTP